MHSDKSPVEGVELHLILMGAGPNIDAHTNKFVLDHLYAVVNRTER